MAKMSVNILNLQQLNIPKRPAIKDCRQLLNFLEGLDFQLIDIQNVVR